MRASKLWTVTVFLIFSFAVGAQAQQSKQPKPAAKQAKTDVKQAKTDVKTDGKEHEQKVRDMVAFLEYVLNTLGNSGTSARDKDVLITESYTKIFRDTKVQVEDDLVEKRNVITNKDVQAYLKDVDFFFDDVKFEFTIKDIQGKVNANDKLFYKVSLLRNIKGMTVEGQAVNNTIPRYIEINYDPKDKDLKIVSIYTKEFDEKVALLNWWKELSFEWQSIFRKKLNIIPDSLSLSDIKNIISIDALDLSQNQFIQSLEPLGQLVDLRELNLSNTTLTDLSPLRNLTELVELNLSNSKIEDISALRYSDKLVKFNINNTAVREISVFEKMTKLQSLEMSNTQVVDFAPLSNLVELKNLNLKNTQMQSLASLETLTNMIELNASGTMVDNLSPLSALKNLTILNLDSTRFTDITALKSLENLQVLYVNYTMISNLRPLLELKHLERIYCDHTPIKRTLADAFMVSNPKVLVIFDSEDLRGWWDTLSVGWKEVLSKAAKIELHPTNEELARIPHLDSLNLADNVSIQDIEPLRKLQKLQVILVGKTAVSDLSPLKEHRDIRSLDISDTHVGDISILMHFTKIKVLKADNTKIQNIDALADLSSIQKIYVDQTGVDNLLVEEFLQRRPNCLVVYKTSSLENWWNEISDGWKEVFRTQVSIDPKSRREDLHKLVELESLHFKDASVSDLSALSAFVRLKELDFSGTSITDVSPLSSIKSLKSLHVTSSPIRELEPLSVLTTLEDLDISNTPVEDLRPLRSLENLKTFNCSGTQVSSLSALEEIQTLEAVDCSNTSVKSIDAIYGLPLKTLKCYNTRISSKAIEKFKDSNPQCNVVYYR